MKTKILYYPVSVYVLTISGEQYESAVRTRYWGYDCNMINGYELTRGKITGIYNIPEDKNQDITFPSDNDDKVTIMRLGDVIDGMGDNNICYEDFQAALDYQILARKIKSRYTGPAILYHDVFGYKGIECWFKDGLKDGTYNEYLNINMMIHVIKCGKYVNGKRDGIWLIKKKKWKNITYDNGVLISVKCQNREITIL